MILHFEICDDCGSMTHGIPLTGFIASGERFDLCGGCQKKPFRVIRGVEEKRRALDERLKGVIETERKLWQSVQL